MPLWLVARAAGARLEKRGPPRHCWRRPGFRSRSCRPISTSAASSASAACRRRRDVALLLAREKAQAVCGNAAGPAGARRRPDAGARRRSVSASRPIAPRRASSSATLRGRTHELHSAWRWCATATVLFEHVRHGAADHARISRTAFSTPISMPPATAVTRSVGGYQLESTGIQLFERIEGDHFTILGLAAVAAAGIRCATRRSLSGVSHDHPRSHRLDRHGQDRRPRGCSRRRACRCTMPTPPCTRSMRARRPPRSRRRFPARPTDGKVDRAEARRARSWAMPPR